MPQIPLALAQEARVALLSDLVHDRLLAGIIAGEYEPGERLRLDELAEQYGVSRTPLREAVTRLARNNFVLVSRNTRTVIAPWSEHDMRQRLAAVTAMAEAGIPDLSSASITTLREVFADIARPDERLMIDLADAVLENAYPLLGAQLRDDLIAPLRFYYAPGARDQPPPDGPINPIDAAWSRLTSALRTEDRDELLAAFRSMPGLLSTSIPTPPHEPLRTSRA